MRARSSILLLLWLALLAGCSCEPATVHVPGDGYGESIEVSTAQGLLATVDPDEPLTVTVGKTHEILEHVQEPWTGDLDGMLKRGFVRILTVHNPLYFSFDGNEQRGLAVHLAHLFEDHLAKQVGRVRSPTVVLIPVSRDELLPGLVEGRGDIVAANLTITADRQAQVSFSGAIFPDVRELVVTGPAAPGVSTFDELVEHGLHLRPSSSYFEHLPALNAARVRQGKEPIPVTPADENLEDHDLLDLVNAGVLPAIVVDSHKAAFWAQIFPRIEVHENLAIHSGAQIGWAVRENSPKLLKSVDVFAKSVRKGTLLGNMTLNRYLKSADWIEEVSGKDRRRRDELARIFQRYARQYDFDWLMIAAQAYQESRFDSKKRSAAGAVGIMQLLPSTAADKSVGIPDVSTDDANIHAGVKYLAFLRDRYFSDGTLEPIDRLMFTIAAYNCGAGGVARARSRARRMGFDPNRWFGHVEVGMYRAVSGEPVSYARNIYKYYVTFKRLEETGRAKERALRRQAGG